MFKKSRICKAALAVLSGAAAVTSMPVYAQGQTIEVTGSRIRATDLETAQPVFVVTQEEIQKTGAITVGDIIQNFTSAGTPDFAKGQVLNGDNDQGGQYINLRNLGTERLLVLVNGKRWTTSVNGFTDLSTVPSALIDRIEVLKDGASAIYGSDAIAGVINFILKKSVARPQASAYVGQNGKGDGRTTAYNFTFGGDSDKSSFVLNFSYQKQDPVWAKDRDITKFSYPSDEDYYGAPIYYYGLGLGPWARIRNVSAAGTATGSTLVLNHTGTFDGVGVGQSSRDIANYHPYAGAAEDLFNPTSQMMFQQGTEVRSLFARGGTELTKSTRVNMTAMISDRSSVGQIAGYPMNSLSQPAFPVYVDKDSYWNPRGNQALGAGSGVDTFFYRRTIEVPRRTVNDVKLQHIDASLEGEVNVGKNVWNWNVTYNYNKTDGVSNGTGNLNLFNLKKALGPSFMNAQGVVQCGTPTSPIPFNLCVPFNILGGPSASTPEALAFVMANGSATFGSKVQSLSADISGSILKLPAGDLGFAAGLEDRKVYGYDRPGQMEMNGLSTDLAGAPTTAQYTVKEGYLELNAPLLKKAPFAESLSVNLATRSSDYSNFGKTNNSKASFLWRPMKDLLGRGTYAEGFRAPTISDYAGGGSQTFAMYTDPCDTRYGSAFNNATTAANCVAAGVPATYRQLQQSGSPIANSNGAQTTSPFFAGVGNATIQPETAVTQTLGLVFSPSALPNFNTSLDWYKVNIKNRVTSLSPNYVLSQCYVFGNQDFCKDITRAADGRVTSVNFGNVNLGEVETSGVDWVASYRMPSTKYGSFNFRMENSYVSTYKTKSSATAEWGPNTVTAWPLYRFRSNFTVDWSRGDFGVTFITRYFSALKDSCWDNDPDAPVWCSNPTSDWSGGTGYNTKKEMVYNDINFSYKTPWKGNLQLGVNNLFNVKPRIVLDQGTSDSSAVDATLPIDRFVYLRYSHTF